MYFFSPRFLKTFLEKITRPLVDRSSADCWSFVGRLLAVGRPSVSRLVEMAFFSNQGEKKRKKNRKYETSKVRKERTKEKGENKSKRERMGKKRRKKKRTSSRLKREDG